MVNGFQAALGIFLAGMGAPWSDSPSGARRIAGYVLAFWGAGAGARALPGFMRAAVRSRKAS